MVSAKTTGATPLVIAARNGHYDIVNYLLTHTNADVEETGSVIFDGETIEGMLESFNIIQYRIFLFLLIPHQHFIFFYISAINVKCFFFLSFFPSSRRSSTMVSNLFMVFRFFHLKWNDSILILYLVRFSINLFSIPNIGVQRLRDI